MSTPNNLDRLQGFLTDYFTADPEEYGSRQPDPAAPAFLLVHGFGAFGEQWRGQIRVLAAAGHHVSRHLRWMEYLSFISGPTIPRFLLQKAGIQSLEHLESPEASRAAAGLCTDIARIRTV